MKHRDLIFDVGLHKGEDSAFYLAKGFRVVAFEADPDLSAICRDKFHAESAEGRFYLVEGAIAPAGSTAEVEFYRNVDRSIWGTTSPAWAARNKALGTRTETIRVQAIDFSQVLATFGVPHYLKIDIEGADHLCLDALHDCPEKPNFISIESDKVSFAHVCREVRTLQALGYVRFAAIQQGAVSAQREPSPAREGKCVGHVFAKGSSGVFGRDLPDDAWLDAESVISRYRDIFLLYRIFGDKSIFGRTWLGRRAIRLLELLFRRRIPGWYDTHAWHSSAVDQS